MCVTVRMTVFLEDEADNTEFLYSRTIIFIQLLMPFCSLEFFGSGLARDRNAVV